MDEEVPPAGTSGGGGAGAAPPARGMRVRPGDAGGGPRSPPLQGCLSPQDGESCLVTWPKGNSKSHWESRAHTRHSWDTEGDDPQPPFSHRTAHAAQRQGLQNH